jgi:hypothetical protein
MAIFGIGAYNGDEDDVSEEFIDNELIGTGWTITEASELHNYFTTLKFGDIIYIKAAFRGADITVKGIGVITDIQFYCDLSLSDTNREKWTLVEY